MSDIIKSLGNLLLSLLKEPWFAITLGCITIAFFSTIFFLSIKRIRSGDEFKFLWIIHLLPNSIIKEQREAFEKLNTDDLQKTQILKILNNINIESAKAYQCESIEEFESTKQHLYNFVLYSTATVLTKTKSNSHRIAIFVKDGNTNQLKIHEGQGYSNDGKTHLRLDINNSAAGRVYVSGDPYISGDITSDGNLFKRHPRSTKTYMSLMCVPIKCGNMVLGVLSIDGQEKDSFTKDDLDYLQYFANAITSLMLIEKTLIKEDDDNEQSAQKQQEHLA